MGRKSKYQEAKEYYEYIKTLKAAFNRDRRLRIEAQREEAFGLFEKVLFPIKDLNLICWRVNNIRITIQHILDFFITHSEGAYSVNDILQSSEIPEVRNRRVKVSANCCWLYHHGILDRWRGKRGAFIYCLKP